MNPVLPWALLIGLVLIVETVLLLVGLSWLMRRSEAAGSPDRAAARPKAKIPAWLWLFLIVAFAVMYRFNSDSRPVRNPARRPPHSRMANLAFGAAVGIPGFLLAVMAVRSLYRHHRDYDRDVLDAARRANSGDVAAAIEDVRTLIAARGVSAPRLNGLGVLMGLGGDWAGALPILREAFALNPGLARENLAVALWKTGELPEAEALLVPALAKPKYGAGTFLNYARILLDLGRIDEVQGFIDRAEASIESTGYVGDPNPRQQLLTEVADVRARLASLRGRKKNAERFEEL